VNISKPKINRLASLIGGVLALQKETAAPSSRTDRIIGAKVGCHKFSRFACGPRSACYSAVGSNVITIDFEAGWLLPSATLFTATSTFASGKYAAAHPGGIGLVHHLETPASSLVALVVADQINPLAFMQPELADIMALRKTTRRPPNTRDSDRPVRK